MLIRSYKELVNAVASFVHSVRLDEGKARLLLGELRNQYSLSGKSAYKLASISEEAETLGLLWDSEEDDEEENADCAGTLLRLTRFPASLVNRFYYVYRSSGRLCIFLFQVNELTALLFLFIQSSVKPERASSLLELTEAQALQLEESLCCELPVKKLRCTYSVSVCVVDRLQIMLRFLNLRTHQI